MVPNAIDCDRESKVSCSSPSPTQKHRRGKTGKTRKYVLKKSTVPSSNHIHYSLFYSLALPNFVALSSNWNHWPSSDLRHANEVRSWLTLLRLEKVQSYTRLPALYHRDQPNSCGWCRLDCRGMHQWRPESVVVTSSCSGRWAIRICVFISLLLLYFSSGFPDIRTYFNRIVARTGKGIDVLIGDISR